jgi:hypothetical protein
MWIVRLALRRPYTFVVASLLVMILGVITWLRTPTDIFPNVDIPVVAVVWQYGGMSADDMEGRIVTPFERFLVTTVNDIEHIESQSLNATGVIKVFFQKGANVAEAMSPGDGHRPDGRRPDAGRHPAAADHPVQRQQRAGAAGGRQLDTIPEQQLFDVTFNLVRNQLITIPGRADPVPVRRAAAAGHGRPRPAEAARLGHQPAGGVRRGRGPEPDPAGRHAKIGDQEYPVRLNSSPDVAAQLNDMPIKTVNGTTVYIRDVANVRDGFQVQTNMVHAGGKRGVLMSVLKQGNASTLDVVDGVKKGLPAALAQLPPDIRDSLKFELLFDQSLFVRAAVDGVVMEAAIAAGLTGLMILLFLGSWRSTLIVIVSIPLSIMVSVILLSAFGYTLNVMTLGGMALAVGILVDDATVEIENIHRNLHHGQAAGAGHPGRGPADRGAGVRRHHLHLPRVRPGRVHQRGGRVPVHPARAGRRVRDDDQLPAEPHAGAHHGALPAGQRGGDVRRPARPGRPARGASAGAQATPGAR